MTAPTLQARWSPGHTYTTLQDSTPASARTSLAVLSISSFADPIACAGSSLTTGTRDALEVLFDDARISERVEGARNCGTDQITDELPAIRDGHAVLPKQATNSLTRPFRDPKCLGIRKHGLDCDLEDAKSAVDVARICPIDLIEIALEVGHSLAPDRRGILEHRRKTLVLPHLIDLTQSRGAHSVSDSRPGALTQQNSSGHASSVRTEGEQERRMRPCRSGY